MIFKNIKRLTASAAAMLALSGASVFAVGDNDREEIEAPQTPARTSAKRILPPDIRESHRESKRVLTHHNPQLIKNLNEIFAGNTVTGLLSPNELAL